MFKKILIANRGEIACRIIRTAKKFNIQCVAIYSDVDKQALHVKMADEAYYIGPAPSQESYLNIKKIIAIAKQAQVDAIHPGYGFLSENAKFAQACEKNNIIFIGPDAAAVRAMGSKRFAKKIMQRAGIPLLPGFYNQKKTFADYKTFAKEIGYPIILKASAGGGGKGMRIVNNEKEFLNAWNSAKREALMSFGDDELILEKYLPHARHIEVQVFADQYGNYLSLFERDCSMQRRQQKIIEEAPAPNIDENLRRRMGEVAIQSAKTINYVNAGTIEFLYDDKEHFYFMEMNTRLQVEHPVTEMITGLDLVEWQLRIAAGEKLPLTQQQIKKHGHAFEARIYAEDPQNNFFPSTGKILHWQTPKETKSVRIDAGVAQNDVVSIYYDSLLAKLIVWDVDRNLALKKLHQALSAFRIVGVKTNLNFLKNITQNQLFQNADISTHLVTENMVTLNITPDISNEIYVLATLYLLHRPLNQFADDSYSPWQKRNNWRLNGNQAIQMQFLNNDKIVNVTTTAKNNIYEVKINDSEFSVKNFLNDNNHAQAMINDQPYAADFISEANLVHVFTAQDHFVLHPVTLQKRDETQIEIERHLLAPMPGIVAALWVAPGQKVNKGDNLVAIEAMKMEHLIIAPVSGTVDAVFCAKGDVVEEGKELLKIN